MLKFLNNEVIFKNKTIAILFSYQKYHWQMI